MTQLSTASLSSEMIRIALAEAEPAVYWLDDPTRPDPRAPVGGNIDCDLLVVGAGFTGLWTALLARQADPHRDVVLLDSQRIGWAASGRNGGFCEASLTHGAANGERHFPGELARLDRLGQANLEAIGATIAQQNIHCSWSRSGSLSVADQPHQVAALQEVPNGSSSYLDQEAVRAEVNSPTYLAGRWHHHSTAMVNPARLCWGLAAAAEASGVRIHEGTGVSQLSHNATAVIASTPQGMVTARHVALATNAYPSPIRRLRSYLAPVYDYVLITEPLDAAQLAAVGWRHRQGVADSGNQFHYYRLTDDNRILWGGYDAIYHFGRRVDPAYDQRPATFTRLAKHFFQTFPQLVGLRFSHTWGGAIDTCSRFAPFFGTAHGGRVAYALGYTGLGVGASRFGAAVMLDLLDRKLTERTELEMVKHKPIPFPPEPFTYLGVAATTRALATADRNGGRRGRWLQLLDRLGIGFDS